MPRIRAFTGYLVDAARAAQVVSPAYDAVSPAMRRAFAESHPQNYLNTMRLREDFPPEQTPSNEQLLAMNKAKLDELLADGSFARFDSPAMFVYRLSNAAHRQTGLVCEVPIDEYQQGHLRKHENTRADKEDLLARYQQVVGVSSSPVCLAHPHHDAIDALLEAQSDHKTAVGFCRRRRRHPTSVARRFANATPLDRIVCANRCHLFNRRSSSRRGRFAPR